MGDVSPLKRDVGSRIPPLIKRNILLFALSQAFVGAGMQMVPTLGAIMVVQLLGSASLAGLGTSILGVSRFLVAYPVGKIADTYGRKPGLILGLLLALAGAIITGLSIPTSSFILFVVGIIVFGLGIGAGQQLRVAAADMFPPSRRAEGLGYVLTGALLGALGGPLIISIAQASSRSLHTDPLALTWLFVPVVLLPSIFLVRLVRPDPKEIAANLEHYYPGYTPPPARANTGNGKVGVTTFLRSYPKLAAFISTFAVQGNMAMMMAMTSLVLAHHGYPLPVISLAVAIHVIGMFGLSLPLGRLADRVGRRAVLLAGIVTAGGAALLVPATSDYWVVTAGIFLVGLGWSCVNVAATALIADTSGPAERGRAIGTNDVFGGASAVVLPLVGGIMAERLGLFSLGILGMALMVVPFILLIRLRESSPGNYGEQATSP
ncbi:MAG: MFS transporter [Chloroflexi bacterium]|nr:MFS transporter [Chloroflexota bacterium]